MKLIQISDQPRPGFRRLVQITADGVRYRLFRSIVTLAVVATAIAFLMNIVTEGLIRRAIGVDVRDALQLRHQIYASTAALAAHSTNPENSINHIASGSSAVWQELVQAGYAVSEEQFKTTLVPQAQRELDRQAFDVYARTPAIQQLLAARMNILPTEVTPTRIWQLLESPAAARWLQETTRAQSLPPPTLSTERITRLAQDVALGTRLTAAERLTRDIGSGFLGLGSRMVWLLLVSLLVCAIGITNAMLMSVTERFSEIATMKCLGALDGVIMGIFVLESCLLGLTGGAIGAFAGVIIGTTRSLSTLGWGFFQQLPLLPLAGAMLIAMGVGLVLSAVAALYPAWQAARLAPMEAMRIQ